MRNKEIAELMGQTVTVDKEYRRHHRGTSRTWGPMGRRSRAGWVTGVRLLQNGEVEFFHDGACFVQKGTVKAIMVAYWPTMKPVPVPLDGFKPGGTTKPTVTWSDQDRKDLSQIMKTWPRDSKGRWM